jgi:hypothetical protein
VATRASLARTEGAGASPRGRVELTSSWFVARILVGEMHGADLTRACDEVSDECTGYAAISDCCRIDVRPDRPIFGC